MNDNREAPGHSCEAQQVTLVGAATNLVLAGLKIFVGLVWHSAALVADGIHSISDLASDAVVLLATRHGRQPADEHHPYGHERFETVATVVLSIMLALVAAGIGWDSVMRMINRDEIPVPGIWVIVVALLSLFSKEWLYQYTMRVARRENSRVLEANAWHHRSDAISSFIVLLGVTGAMVGAPVLDALAAMIVALMIAQISWGLLSSSVRELVDTAVDEEIQAEIEDLITGTDGVINLHMLRTRLMGNSILVDAHIQVSPRLSVSEGHHIAEQVEARLLAGIEGVQDVTIHVDPEDDEVAPVSDHLPLRKELLDLLDHCWRDIPEASRILDIVLHYLDGKVEVEIVLPLPEGGGSEARRIREDLISACRAQTMISRVLVHFE